MRRSSAPTILVCCTKAIPVPTNLTKSTVWEINAGYLTDQQRRATTVMTAVLKKPDFPAAPAIRFSDQFSGALYASRPEDVLNKQYLGP